MTRRRLHDLRWIHLALAGGLACGGSVPQNAAPSPESGPEYDGNRPLPPAVVAAEMSVDDDADSEALHAIRELEFGTLTKGSSHVRGVVAVAPVGLPDAEPTNRSRGGAAEVSYDFDVDTWMNESRVRYYMDYFRDPARYRFEVWLSRLNRYEGMIKDRLRHYGLPDDLLYLALIESGYSNTAVSRASAVGMWQFIQSTGRHYGLRIDDWVDERRDPFKATDAAARHLIDLKDQFGSWYLAAAAYNAGATRVERGLRRLRGSAGRSDAAFFSMAERRYLRRETRDYVPKLIAATVLAKNAASYGFEVEEPMGPLVYDEITVPGQTGLDVLAALADTTTRAIMELNPHYFRGATPPREQATVRVPRGTAAQVLDRYQGLDVAERVNFIEHTIRRGETLSLIAQRYRVQLRYVQRANPGLNPRRLRVGTRLIIPVSRAAQLGRVDRRTRSAPQRTLPPADGRHRIREGDSLWRVSQQYGITVADLRRWNGIPENVTFLEVGQRLWVRAPTVETNRQN